MGYFHKKTLLSPAFALTQMQNWILSFCPIQIPFCNKRTKRFLKIGKVMKRVWNYKIKAKAQYAVVGAGVWGPVAGGWETGGPGENNKVNRVPVWRVQKLPSWKWMFPNA